MRRSNAWPCRPALSGGEVNNRGLNRASSFSFIRAEHDLAAVHAYLHRYRDRPTTLRAYTRELERLVLWSVVVRGVALSSMTVEDCEAYKDFLKAPLPVVHGTQAPTRERALAAVRARRIVGRQSGVRGARDARGLCVAGRGPLSRRKSVERSA